MKSDNATNPPQSTKHWRTRAALALGGSVLTLTLPFLFLAPPAAAQSSTDQTAITELLQSVIALQKQVMSSGNRELLTQNQGLLNQVRTLMAAIEAGDPLPDMTATTANDEAAAEETDDRQSGTAAEASTESTNNTDGTESNTRGTVTTTDDVTICPELSITQRELRSYVDGAYALEREGQIGSYNPVIPPGIECLGEAIIRECDTAMARHEDGYTFYVTAGESAYDHPIYGTTRCYVGMSVTNAPDQAAQCNLNSIADRGPDASDLFSENEIEWFLKVTLPEFFADHAWPLDDSYSYYGSRDRGTYHYGTNPVARLAAHMACTYRAVDIEPEAAS